MYAKEAAGVLGCAQTFWSMKVEELCDAGNVTLVAMLRSLGLEKKGVARVEGVVGKDF